jgi:hypothetical protein
MSESHTPPPPPPGQTPPAWLNKVAPAIPQPGEASFIGKLIAAVFVLGVVLISGYFIVRWVNKEKPIDPVYGKVEAIKRVRHLRLVKHRYETIIPVTKPKGRLEFLLLAPAEVHGYLDLGQMKMQVEPDSLIKCFLPEAELSEVSIDLDQSEEFTGPERKGFLGFRPQAGNFSKAFTQIASAIQKSKAQVADRAVKNHILRETQEKGEDYIRNLLNGLGYRVEFELLESESPDNDPELTSAIEAMLEESDSERQSLLLTLLLKRLQR